MTILNKICQHCKTPFVDNSNRRQKKFCSNACVGLSRRKCIKFEKCQNCDIKLNTYQYKFCCSSCAGIFNNSNRSNESREKQRQSLNINLSNTGRSRTDAKEIFYRKCFFRQWKLDVWKRVPGNELIDSIGKFHPTLNKFGAVRDHLVSKFDAYKNGYDPEHISHPANCRIIPNLENITKGTESSITYQELLERIKLW